MCIRDRFAAFGLPLSVIRSSNELADEIGNLEGFELVEVRTSATFFLGESSDVITVTLQASEPTADVQRSFRDAMAATGFSHIFSMPADNPQYFMRARTDSLDADMYRFVSIDSATSEVVVGIRFFDADLYSVAAALLVGAILSLGGLVLCLRMRTSSAHTQRSLTNH